MTMEPEIGSFRNALSARPQLGLCIMYPAAGMIERIGRDWDWLWIDGQHGEMDYREILCAVRAANFVGRPAVVRVPGHEYSAIGRVLDLAPDGIMVPMVENRSQAQKIVEAAKFPPLGCRSYGGRRPVDLFGRAYAQEHARQPLLICQIESPAGLNNVMDIAGVPGVDALFFGPDDLALRAGVPMDAPAPEDFCSQGLSRIAMAALTHGKIAGGLFTTPQRLQAAVRLGYRLMAGGGDAGMIAVASRSLSLSLRSGLEQESDRRNALPIC